MSDLSDLPPPLARLAQKLLDAVDGLSAELERGEIGVTAWQREMERLLVRYHVAAYMTGQESEVVSDNARALIVEAAQVQLEYLNGFAAAIAAGGWAAGYQARAELYALAIKTTYWQGATSKTGLPPLPHYPGDGSSACLSNCNCSLDIQEVSAERGDYDIYWRLGAEKHCTTCPQRAASWSPLKVRNGRIV